MTRSADEPDAQPTAVGTRPTLDPAVPSTDGSTDGDAYSPDWGRAGGTPVSPPRDGEWPVPGDQAAPARGRRPELLTRRPGMGTDREPLDPGDDFTLPWHRNGTGPVPTLHGPVKHRWRKVAGRTLSKAWGDSLFGMSSQAAFWCALSTAPLLLALLGLVGYVLHWFPAGTIDQVRDQIFVFLNQIFDREVADNLVGDTVNTILDNGRSDVVSVGLVISLWAGSSAMSAFVESITIAYGQHEVRHPVVERFFALGLYLVALFAGILLLPLVAIGPEYLPRLFPQDWRDNVASIVNISYYPVLAISMILLLTTLYKVAPKHRHAWKRGLPGAFLAAAVFLVASFGLRLYLSYVYSHGLTYGALATPITFLLFYYFACMAIVIGAQFNNALLEFYPPRRSRRELKRWQKYQPVEPAQA
ncbi:membrane protein [Nakamurella flavida]|nr:YihY/virulence factor BrkB family protein [Nakamurella flavida]MDP9777405.1 membrane protein [Nakamurella flavida]